MKSLVTLLVTYTEGKGILSSQFSSEKLDLELLRDSQMGWVVKVCVCVEWLERKMGFVNLVQQMLHLHEKTTEKKETKMRALEVRGDHLVQRLRNQEVQ